MKILVTGAGGMFGTDACATLRARGHEVVATGRAEGLVPLDVSDARACEKLISATRPDVILHCAAWTNVDGAERTPEEAYRGNVLSTANIAQAAASVGAWAVFLSTDYVFDGNKKAPYTEFDAVNPLGVYGATKEQAEQVARQILPTHHLIVRTSWLFGGNGKNFVRTILRLGKQCAEVPVVADQLGTPTYTRDLAEKIADLLEAPLIAGTYHISNDGFCSWYQFAKEIAAQANLPATIVPITAVEYAQRFQSPTRRPAYSVMRRLALELRGMDDMPSWQDALHRFLNEAALS